MRKTFRLRLDLHMSVAADSEDEAINKALSAVDDLLGEEMGNALDDVRYQRIEPNTAYEVQR